MTEYIDVDTPAEGDVATHRTAELDPRVVSRVETNGDAATLIWLRVGERTDIGPFPAANYTFTRRQP